MKTMIFSILILALFFTGCGTGNYLYEPSRARNQNSDLNSYSYVNPYGWNQTQQGEWYYGDNLSDWRRQQDLIGLENELRSIETQLRQQNQLLRRQQDFGYPLFKELKLNYDSP